MPKATILQLLTILGQQFGLDAARQLCVGFVCSQSADLGLGVPLLRLLVLHEDAHAPFARRPLHSEGEGSSCDVP